MKKILILLLCAVITVNIAACSKDSEDINADTEETSAANGASEEAEEVSYENLSPSQLIEAFETAENGVYTQSNTYSYNSSPEDTYTSISVAKHDGDLAEFGEYNKDTYEVISYYDFGKCLKYKNENSLNYSGWYSYEIPETPTWEAWVESQLLSDLGDLFSDENYDLTDDGAYVWKHPESLTSFWFEPSQIQSIKMSSEGKKYTFSIIAEKSSRSYDMKVIFEFTDTEVTIPDSVVTSAK